MNEYIYDEDELDLVLQNQNKKRLVCCKDCKYAGTNDCVLDIHVQFKPVGFCSWGDER